MDDSTKNPTVSNPVQPVAQDSVQVEAVQTSQPATEAKIVPVNPVSAGISKEAPRPVSDYAVKSESLPKIEKELSDIGVEAHFESVKLTPEHKDLGVEHSLENNVPNLNPTGAVTLPISEEVAENAVKQNKGKISLSLTEQSDSIYILPSIFGFATLILKNLKKMHGKIMGKN
jgi:hypothetical protein